MVYLTHIEQEKGKIKDLFDKIHIFKEHKIIKNCVLNFLLFSSSP